MVNVFCSMKQPGKTRKRNVGSNLGETLVYSAEFANSLRSKYDRSHPIGISKRGDYHPLHSIFGENGGKVGLSKLKPSSAVSHAVESPVHWFSLHCPSILSTERMMVFSDIFFGTGVLRSKNLFEDCVKQPLTRSMRSSIVAGFSAVATSP